MTSSPKKLEQEPSKYVDVDLPASKLQEWRSTLVRRWSRSPMQFLTAIDPTTTRTDGRPSHVWVTTDERKQKGIFSESAEVGTERPFPPWAYLSMLFGLYQREEVVGIEKSRQVFATTATLAYAFWVAAFHSNQKVLLSKANAAEAEQLLEEKIRIPWGRMPPWLKDRFEIKDKPADLIRFRSTTTPRHNSSNSVIQAVAENAALRGLRGGTASLVIIDEAALQANLSAMLRAAAPMAARIICLTSADGGQAGGEAFINYFDCAPERKKNLKPIAIPKDDFRELPEASVLDEEPSGDEFVPLEEGDGAVGML